MILVDTSVWIDYLRNGDAELTTLLDGGRVLMHPFVLGELACGNLLKRDKILKLLGDLPRISVASDAEALFFIEQHELMGRGIGYVDVHLLAAVTLESTTTRLWTRDKRLRTVADTLALAYKKD